MAHETIVNLISQATGLLSAVILYWGSFGVKWEGRTIKGTSPRELLIELLQFHLGWIGCLFAVIAIGCQTYLTLRA